ncbi:hypothetical protein BGZ96_003862 [Linnemannia gamsii]|uniref:Uncharacterized protein n=1 Tax=Linnemannia gamsii TaxID=64522 RepID=A0ABQ7K797_9FUNG|nr:hypothetical protein BGZ96_003862 [Linnemannia gamsii]
MANEGTLNLDCIAADPKSEYLYGIASANTNPHTNYADSHIVLVQSNKDPTNLASMTWSVVSSSTSPEVSYNYPTFTSVDCAVSKNGDFTAFVRSPYRDYGDHSYRMFQEDDMFGECATFNYTRQGFFSRQASSSTKMIAIGGTDIYMTGLPLGSEFMTFSYRQGIGLGSRVEGAFEGPRNGFRPHYVFGGLYRFSWEGIGESSNTETFFGSIGEMDGVYKLYTTVRDADDKNQSYVEHNITRSDTTANFTVHENFQTVGGGIKDQQAFVVALTSRGLYEFGIFGSDAGKMKGPYSVVVPGGFSSLPSRVVTNFKDGTMQSNMMSSMEMYAIIGVLMLAVVVVVGFYERWSYKKNKFLFAEKEGGSARNGGVVYSIGLIPECESLSAPSYSAVHTIGASAVTYQDQIKDLEFSSHPRPNFVTTVGEKGGVV